MFERINSMRGIMPIRIEQGGRHTPIARFIEETRRRPDYGATRLSAPPDSALNKCRFPSSDFYSLTSIDDHRRDALEELAQRVLGVRRQLRFHERV